MLVDNERGASGGTNLRVIVPGTLKEVRTVPVEDPELMSSFPVDHEFVLETTPWLSASAITERNNVAYDTVRTWAGGTLNRMHAFKSATIIFKAKDVRNRCIILPLITDKPTLGEKIMLNQISLRDLSKITAVTFKAISATAPLQYAQSSSVYGDKSPLDVFVSGVVSASRRSNASSSFVRAEEEDSKVRRLLGNCYSAASFNTSNMKGAPVFGSASTPVVEELVPCSIPRSMLPSAPYDALDDNDKTLFYGEPITYNMTYFPGFKSKEMPEQRRIPHLRIGRKEGYLRACKDIANPSKELTRHRGFNVGTTEVSWLNRVWDINDVREEIDVFNRSLAEHKA